MQRTRPPPARRSSDASDSRPTRPPPGSPARDRHPRHGGVGKPLHRGLLLQSASARRSGPPRRSARSIGRRTEPIRRAVS